MCALPLLDVPEGRVVELRRQFGALHDQLRSEGRNPVEAVGVLASLLTSDESGPPRAVSAAAVDLLRSFELRGHAASVAFQELLTGEARHGLGQYLTPLPVADLIARICAARRPATVLDPFAGSAILLERLRSQLPTAGVVGVEINETISSVARAVMTLAGDGTSIVTADAFAEWASGRLTPVDAVITNPPFGALVTNAGRSALLHKAPPSLLKLRRLPAELAGLELCIQLLRQGGFLAIVLPQSVLSNASWAPYRRDVFSRVSPVAVLSLPEATFTPFRGVAKACVLFAVRTAAQLPAIFPFARSQSIGWDDTGRVHGTCDLPDLAEVVLAEKPLPQAAVDEDGAFRSVAGDVGPDTCILGDIAEVFTGITLPREGYVTAGPRLLKVGDLSGGFVTWSARARTCVPEEVFAKTARKHLRVGDICLTAAAHRPRYIGLKVDLIDYVPPEGAMASAEVMVIRLHDRRTMTSEQLLYYLRSRPGFLQLQDLVRGSTAHIYPKDVAKLRVPALGKRPGADRIAPAYWQAAEAFRSYLALEAAALGIASQSLGEMGEMTSTAEEDISLASDTTDAS